MYVGETGILDCSGRLEEVVPIVVVTGRGESGICVEFERRELTTPVARTSGRCPNLGEKLEANDTFLLRSLLTF